MSCRSVSCSIAYTSAGQPFAEQRCSDLRHNRVSCWLTASMSGALNFPYRGYREICEKLALTRFYDQCVFVLSRHLFVQFAQLEERIQDRLAWEEDLQQQLSIFVWLDDSHLLGEETRHKTLQELRCRGSHIDLSGWRDHTVYRKAFTQLLHYFTAQD